MKRLLILSIISLCLALVMAYGGTNVVNCKVYNSTLPGETYFVSWSNANGRTTVTYTNKESSMWYPLKIGVYNSDKMNTTTTVDLVTVLQSDLFADDTVTTNDAGFVTTNHFHGAITNTTYTYITNRLCTITNTTSATYSETITDLSNQYVLYGDKIIWGLQQSNCWLKIIGNR